MIEVGLLDSSNNFITASKPTVIETVNGIKIMGTADSNGQFIQPNRHPVAFQTNGNVTLQGTLDSNGNFISPSKPIAFQTTNDITLQGTLDSNGDFISPSSMPIAYKTTGNITVQGTLNSNGDFIASNKPTAYRSDNGPEPEPSVLDGALGLWYAMDYDDSVRKSIPNTNGTLEIDSNILSGSRRMFSSAFDASTWNAGNCVATDCNHESPDGSMEASTITSESNSLWSLSQSVSLPAGTYTACVSIKDLGGDFTQFYLGQPYEQESLFTITDQWQRLVYTFTLNDTNPTGAIGIRSSGAGSQANFAVVDIELFQGNQDLNQNWQLKPTRITNSDLVIGRNQYQSPIFVGDEITLNNLHSKIQFSEINTPPAITIMFNGTRANQNNDSWEALIAQSAVRGKNFDNFTFGQDVVAGPDFRLNGSESANQQDDGLFGGCGFKSTFAITFDGNEQTWFINGSKVNSTNRTANVPEIGDWIFGSRNGSSDFSNYRMGALAVWDRALSHDEIKNATAEIESHTIMPDKRLVILEGDSITFQMRATVGKQLTKPGFGWNHAVINSIITGDPVSLVGRSTMIDDILSTSPANTTGILTVLIGANDLLGYEDADQWLSDFQSYIESRKASGWKIVVGTVLPRGDSAEFNTRRNYVNPIIRSWQGTICDAIADYAANPLIGDDDSYWNNTNLWSDPVHPGTQGHAIMYPILAEAIDSID